MAKAIKIPVHHYTEITRYATAPEASKKNHVYITNEGGKKYLVEVLA